MKNNPEENDKLRKRFYIFLKILLSAFDECARIIVTLQDGCSKSREHTNGLK